MQNVLTFLIPAHDGLIRDSDAPSDIANAFSCYGISYDDAIMGLVMGVTVTEITPQDGTVDDLVTMITEMHEERFSPWNPLEDTDVAQKAAFDERMKLVDKMSQFVHEANLFLDPFMGVMLKGPGTITDVGFKRFDSETYLVTITKDTQMEAIHGRNS